MKIIKIEKPKPKVKVCKLCGGKRYQNTTLCYKCMREALRAKLEASKARAKERKLNSKGYQEKSRKLLAKRCWTLMSLWVRKKDADWRGYNTCFTCGKTYHYKEMNAGHYIHDKLDFDERNLKPQCVRCNLRLSGNLGIYAEKLLMINGENWLWELRKDAQEKGNNYSYEELLEIEKDLTNKIKELT